LRTPFNPTLRHVQPKRPPHCDSPTIYSTHVEIDQLITEDLPLHDETTRALGMPDAPGTLTYTDRQP
jgi:hypothetical protein